MNKEENISLLKAQLDEKRRIENYLRNEVKELRDYLSIVNKLNKIISLILSFKKKCFSLLSFFKNLVKPDNSNYPKLINYRDKINADILFVLPSTEIEFGGSYSAYKFSKLLSTKGFKLIYITEKNSPINNINSPLVSKSQLNNLEKIKVIISTGAETQKLVDEITVQCKNVKRITLIQGPDPYFTPKWNDAKLLLKNIETSDLVITTSFFLEKLATDWGSKKTLTLIFDIDRNIFKILTDDIKRDNIILISCRPNTLKGLQILLPSIPILRKKGYKIIGFGILPDLEMAREFDDFYGVLTPSELCKIYNKAKILMDPSLIEGFGRVALEAALCGCIPIIQRRFSYNSLFEIKNEPYVEIDSFQQPDQILNALQIAEETLNPQIIKTRAEKLPLHYNFDKFIFELTSLMQ